jgi:citrate lyase subunit beta/citryl-CoA lyase
MNPPVRSLLFVPGDRPERFGKAHDSGADVVIIDLEDAVSPAHKTSARRSVSDWLTAGHRAMVRVNATDTSWFEDDLAMVCAVRSHAVMLPKAEPTAISRIAGALAPDCALHALVETVAGLTGLRETARTPGVARLVFGNIDFSIDSGIEGTGEELNFVRSQIVIESRAAGLPAPVDGVSLVFDDDTALAEEVARSRRFGFGGKLCIHPRQVAAVRAAFCPSSADIDRATRIVEAMRSSGGGAVALNGKMIDKPVLEWAHRILADNQNLAPATAYEKRGVDA